MTADHGRRKYILLVGDGMADYGLEELDGRTPIEAARTPHLDRIAGGRIGLVKTVPDGMEPGSDVANLSLLGYDPRKYYSGRAPLEAASMGIALRASQVAFRMNLVTLEFRSDQEVIMKSHSSGDISASESMQILETLKEQFRFPGIELYGGIAYRNLLLWENGPEHAVTIPPHDVLEQNMAPYLHDSSENPIPTFIRRSWDILLDHPTNRNRRDQGLDEANSIWLWGQGKTPRLPLFKDRYGIDGMVISAVDLVKGIGLCVGLAPLHVQGATGYFNTNYRGKAEAGLKGLEDGDFILIHVEAPDEAGHNGRIREKIEAIEHFDEKVVGTLLEGLKAFEDYRVMVASDHLTPISKRTHTDEPTPFAWASKRELELLGGGSIFSEAAARQSGLFFGEGQALFDSFLFGD
ncbi:MAG: cofactor-independent phosphoglycerate mutase [Thermodesulfobacteriota bacterium]